VLATTAALCLGVAVTALLTGSANPAAATESTGIQTLAAGYQQATDPAVIFAEQCAPCHGAEGQGSSAPSLQTSALTPEERTAIIRGGRAGMPAFGPTLTDAEIQAVSDLTARFRSVGIYAEQCAPCHGVAGEGGVGPSLITSVLLPSEATEIITAGRAGMPAFGPTLSSEEIRTVVSFLGDIGNADAAGAALYAMQCAPCHGDNREGGVGPPLLNLTLDPLAQMTVIIEGSGGMPAFGPTLTAEQLSVLEVFLNAPSSGEPDRATGEAAYAAYCAGCHGAELEGGAGPSLADLDLSEDDAFRIVRDGLGTMPGFADSLSPEDIAAVVAFLSPGPTDGTPPDTAPPLDPTVAADLYATNCRTCHGGSGEGGAGPSLLDTGLTDEELTSVVADGVGTMPGFKAAFTPEEIEAVARFVAALGPATEVTTPRPLDAPPGEAIFLGNCAECHGAFGEGDSGPMLAGSDLSANEIVVGVWSGHSDDMPAFHESLTPDEILAVSNYAADLPPFETDDADAGSPLGGSGSRGVIALIVAGVAAIGMVIVAFGRRPRAPRQRE
jgi:mono/diheme cytochrome c family protein